MDSCTVVGLWDDLLHCGDDRLEDFLDMDGDTLELDGVLDAEEPISFILDKCRSCSLTNWVVSGIYGLKESH